MNSMSLFPFLLQSAVSKATSDSSVTGQTSNNSASGNLQKKQQIKEDKISSSQIPPEKSSKIHSEIHQKTSQNQVVLSAQKITDTEPILPQIPPKKTHFSIYFVKTAQRNENGKTQIYYWHNLNGNNKIEKNEILKVGSEIANNEKALYKTAVAFAKNLSTSKNISNNHPLLVTNWSPVFGLSLVQGERGKEVEQSKYKFAEKLRELEIAEQEGTIQPFEKKLMQDLKKILDVMETIPVAIETGALTSGMFGGFYVHERVISIRKAEVSSIGHELIHAAIAAGLGIAPWIRSSQNKTELVELDYSGTPQYKFTISSKAYTTLAEQSTMSAEGKASVLHMELPAYSFECRLLLSEAGITQKEMDETKSGDSKFVKDILLKVETYIKQNREKAYPIFMYGEDPETIDSKKEKSIILHHQNLLAAYFGFSTNLDKQSMKLIVEDRNTNLHDYLQNKPIYKQFKDHID